MTGELEDLAARERIETDTGATLFVEASAGSGKTKSLVDRVRTSVLRDGVSLQRIAAVTFTEKAGAELRDRLRAEFEGEWLSRTDERRSRAEQALSDLDSAAIGTLHSFAQRILSMHSIDAGLPPLIEVLDEVGSSVAFDERWSVLQRDLLDDQDLAPAVLRALEAGVTLAQLRSLMKAFGSDWDLVEDRVVVDTTVTPPPDLDRLIDDAILLGLREIECRDPTDRFLPDLTAFGDWGRRLRNAADGAEQYQIVEEGADLRYRHGKAHNWPDLPALKEECRELVGRIRDARIALMDATLRPLARWIAERVVESAERRATAGRLEFHDLLVLTRRVMRTNAEVRGALHEQYSHLLLDEFQDTDPIQIELAVRLAAGTDGDAASWRDIEVPDGALFVVGDPKQSIYRFRRADIRTYLAAQDHIGETLSLTTNFRTVGPVLEWVNRVFDRLIEPVPDMQPTYQPLAAHRSNDGTGVAVTVLGAEAHLTGNADALREAEAADVAGIVGKALAEGWTVMDPRTGSWNPIAPKDIAILLPARTSLPHLQSALDAAGIAYRAESSSLVYQAAEIRDLMAAIRVVADPSDLLSCVTALRSPLFGCGDDDLWSWKSGGGSFNILAPVPADRAGHVVGTAVSYLRDLHYRSRWMTPSQVLGAVIDDRRMLEVATAGPRARDVWRRLRFTVDQARAWSESEQGGLRGYLAWAARQADETARVSEAVLPETDVDAVRIMTVHAAKGLEFGMVVMSGMTSAPRNLSGVKVIWPPAGGFAIRLSKHIETNDFQAAQPVDEQMDQYERIRLMYVAATRARDHLVVSLHRKGGRQTNALTLYAAGASDGVDWFTAGAGTAGPLPRSDVDPPPKWDAWWEQISAARDSSGKSSTVSASGLEGSDPAVVLEQLAAPEPGAAKGVRDLELPPWAKGRYGTAIGRAVHGALQVVDLVTGDGLDAAVATQCVAEGVTEFASVVADLVRSALASDLIKDAAGRHPLRESQVATRLEDGTVLEGIIDLMFRDADGRIVIVDYKTDAVPAAALPSRVDYYRPQVEAYRRAVSAATGEPVVTVLQFLHPTAPAVSVTVEPT